MNFLNKFKFYLFKFYSIDNEWNIDENSFLFISIMHYTIDKCVILEWLLCKRKRKTHEIWVWLNVKCIKWKNENINIELCLFFSFLLSILLLKFPLNWLMIVWYALMLLVLDHRLTFRYHWLNQVLSTMKKKKKLKILFSSFNLNRSCLFSTL